MTRTWLRVTAWVVGAVTFFGPWAALGLSPKPVDQASADPVQPPKEERRPRRVIHRVIRRVIVIHTAPAAPSGVNVVYAGGGSSGGYSGGYSGSSGSGGVVASSGGS